MRKASRTAKKTKATCLNIQIDPMMPRRFSARQRQEIRQKELQILKGLSK